MRQSVCILLFTIFCLEVIGQTKLQRIEIAPNQEKLSLLADKLKTSQSNQKNTALDYAKKNGLNTGKIYRNNRVVEIQKLSPRNSPLYYTTYNIDAAKTSGTQSLWTGENLGLNLNGESMTLGVWEGEPVRTAHQEFGGRVIMVDGTQFTGSTSGTEHATHVSGTMIASGVSPSAKGMAPAASLRASDWNSDESEMAAFAGSGFLISNHSYGFCTDPGPERQGGCSWENWRFGYYDEVAANWDEIAYEAPYYLIVKASGNDRNDNKNISRNGFDLLEGSGTSKNVLVVGAVEDVTNYSGPLSVDLAIFSSTGPTDDGRIKPDIVGNGVNVRSSFSNSNNDYETISGTSMATPNVSGSLILLQQHYNNLNESFMKSSTLRGLIIHTAKEAGSSPGPDYEFGWGLINVESAADVISKNNGSTLIEEHTLNNGESFQKIIEADGLSPLIVTICWTDPKGTQLTEDASSENSTTRLLVNDLDSRLSNSEESFSPWVLNPFSLGSAAVPGDNSRDNVEKIEIENPVFGEYVITISHKGTLLNASQNFSLIVSGIVPSSCKPAKPGNFQANEITDQSAIISWDPLLGVNNYNGRYREKGLSNWVDFNTTSNFFTLTGLLAGTVYEVEMQSLCSVVDISGFSEPFSFQTECRADIPANRRFDGITTTSIHLDWDTVRAVQSYELRYRKSGATWQAQTTTISETTLSNLSPGDTYEFQVSSKCSSGDISNFSNSVEFTPYCLAEGENSENEWIQLFQAGTINNESGNDKGYADFSHLSTQMKKGEVFDIGLQAGQLNYFPKYWTIWIDFNQNGRFTDIGEKVLSSPVDADKVTTHQLTIPSDALSGSTLLRVSMKYNDESNSCEKYTYGETEDYAVDIQEEIDTSGFFPIIGQSASNASLDQSLVIYPNPSSTEISVNLTPDLTGTEITIMDLSGNILIDTPFYNRLIIDINSLARGVYLVRVETSKGPQVDRFVKN